MWLQNLVSYLDIQRLEPFMLNFQHVRKTQSCQTKGIRFWPKMAQISRYHDFSWIVSLHRIQTENDLRTGLIVVLLMTVFSMEHFGKTYSQVIKSVKLESKLL